jgi:acetylornithine aminotransferase
MGLLINAPGESIIRIAPPLNVTMKQAQKFITIFSQCVKEAHNV